MRHVLFLLSSARNNGRAGPLARIAAQRLPAGTERLWLRLRESPFPPFEDGRPTLGVCPQRHGKHFRTVSDGTGTPQQAQAMFGTLRLWMAHFGATISSERLRSNKPGNALNAARPFFRS